MQKSKNTHQHEPKLKAHPWIDTAPWSTIAHCVGPIEVSPTWCVLIYVFNQANIIHESLIFLNIKFEADNFFLRPLFPIYMGNGKQYDTGISLQGLPERVLFIEQQGYLRLVNFVCNFVYQ